MTNWLRVTPDGRQVLFTSASRARIVSIDAGGAPSTIADIDAFAPDVSPDGRKWRSSPRAPRTSSRSSSVICRVAARSSASATWLGHPIARGSTIRFTPDHSGIAYVNVSAEPNIWIQPLDGSAPRTFTQFTDGRSIFDFVWSSDGKGLAIARGTFSTDIVLFSGLRSL